MKKRGNNSNGNDGSGNSKRTQNRRTNTNRRQNVRGPQVGQIVNLSDVGEGGLMPVEQKRFQPKRTTTGTEEILGTIDIDYEAESKSWASRGKDEKEVKLEPLVNSMITKSNLKSTSAVVPDSIRKRGFRAIWEDALKKDTGSTSTTSIYDRPKNIYVPAYPLPLAQPARCLNRFSTKKLPLEEPRFRQVNNKGNMIFHEEFFKRRFDGTRACSKVATGVFDKIFNQKKNGLFIMQLPNSLRTITNENKNNLVDEDVKLKEQNELDENGVPKGEQLKVLVLQNFQHDQPFGKIQILKSGRIVLKIGNRRLDIVTTSPIQEHDVGAIVDHQETMQGNFQQGRFSVNQKPSSMHVLGKVNQYFSAFYDYSKVLDELSLESDLEETPKMMKNSDEENQKIVSMKKKKVSKRVRDEKDYKLDGLGTKATRRVFGSCFPLVTLSPMASQQSVDPVSIWTRSQILDKIDEDPKALDKLISKTEVAERYHGKRSIVWTSLSEITGPNRQTFITNMVKNWPYYEEKYAMIIPAHISTLSTCVTSSVVASKINADLFLYNPKAGYLESIKKCPKSPLILPIYACGLLSFAFYNKFVFSPFMNEEAPCPSCALSRFAAIMVGSGALFPAVITPALAHYVNVQRNPEIPAPKNLLEFVTLIYMASKPSWSVLPKLAILQIIVASIGTYSLLWGREKIFGAVDMEPELLKEALMKSQTQSSFKAKINAVCNRISFLKPFADDITVEEEHP
ncbi:hypothetical protein FO519_002831 [Halicephalobus sp. NKZ332]|nr:hypothetical protein FO519_002831 [Halicephalobus sp. NKZ332]